MTGRERRDELLLYAAGVLDQAERQAVLTYLEEGGPRAAGELAEAEAVVAEIGLSLDPVVPPERVKQGLMRRIREAAPRPLRSSVSPAGRPPGRGRRPATVWLRAGLGGVAAALLITLGVHVSLMSHLHDVEAVLEQRNAQLVTLQVTEAALSVIRASQLPTVRVIELEGPALRTSGFGRMYQDWQSGACYLYVRGMRSPGRGVYTVWFTNVDGNLVSGGQLEVAENGEASFFTRLPRDIDVAAPVLVTLEPNRRGHQPTGTPQLRGEA